ncbi:MAG: hypothetical protein ACREJO_11800 [Phycisphaerales bacterium]
MERKWTSLMFAAVCLAAGPALAGIETLPPWSQTGIIGESTHWRWDFPTAATASTPTSGTGIGTPQIAPSPDWTWQPTSPTGGQGVMSIVPGGSVVVTVPNFPRPNEFKLIWIQYHWFGTGAEPATSASANGVAAAPYGPTITPSPGVGGGLVGARGWQFPFNPELETITIHNPDLQNFMYIDWLVIDTICAPSPEGAAVLAIAGLVAMSRRRR